MEKKKFRDCFSHDEYWMGIAFFLCAKFSSKHIMIAVENNELVCVSRDEPLCASDKYEHHRQPEIDIITKCNNSPSCVVYCTFTPSYSVISSLACAGLRRVIFYKTKDLSEDSQDLVNYRTISVSPFAGNLNWMRDYISILDSSGIFA
jgi:hypothetical protein